MLMKYYSMSQRARTGERGFEKWMLRTFSHQERRGREIGARKLENCVRLEGRNGSDPSFWGE
jgi:hypothetical protein